MSSAPETWFPPTKICTLLVYGGGNERWRGRRGFGRTRGRARGVRRFFRHRQRHFMYVDASRPDSTGLRAGWMRPDARTRCSTTCCVGRSRPSVAGDRRRDGLAVMSLDWLRVGTGKQVKGRKEGRRWEEKCAGGMAVGCHGCRSLPGPCDWAWGCRC